MWKFGHKGNYSASPGLPSDAEQLSRVTEFSFRTELLHFFDQEMFGSAPLRHVGAETFAGKMTWTWRQDVLMSCMTVVLHPPV